MFRFPLNNANAVKWGHQSANTCSKQCCFSTTSPGVSDIWVADGTWPIESHDQAFGSLNWPCELALAPWADAAFRKAVQGMWYLCWTGFGADLGQAMLEPVCGTGPVGYHTQCAHVLCWPPVPLAGCVAMCSMQHPGLHCACGTQASWGHALPTVCGLTWCHMAKGLRFRLHASSARSSPQACPMPALFATCTGLVHGLDPGLHHRWVLVQRTDWPSDPHPVHGAKWVWQPWSRPLFSQKPSTPVLSSATAFLGMIVWSSTCT